ncbi:deoxyribonuclease [Clostridia bacterium]|nr:deoxyribonuclease [Clostridia bacterium]
MCFFDTHAHYDDEKFDFDRNELLASLPARGVALVVVPGCTIPSTQAAIALSERFSHVYAAAGVHPHSASNFLDVSQLIALAKHPKVCAIGEIGLDYHYDFSPHEVQREAFTKQLELAQELCMPVIIHDREAHADTLEILRRFKVRAVFHCYSGSLEQAKILVNLGHSISFTGSVTFKNARRALETAAWLPDDRIMLETDAPYMTPVPHRGKRNDSSYLPYIAEAIAEVRGVSAETVAELTYRNGLEFFGIEDTL